MILQERVDAQTAVLVGPAVSVPVPRFTGAFIMRSITFSAFTALALVSSAAVKVLMMVRSMLKALVDQLRTTDWNRGS